MKVFTFSDLSRRSGDVLDAAMAEPVQLMKRGKAKVVMMPIAQFERLERRLKERTAFTLDDAPGEDIQNLVSGFQAIVDDDERPDR